MSGFSASVPVEHLDAANAALEELGHGACFSRPMAPDAEGATHAGFHAWHDPVFRAAVEALDPAYGVVIRDTATASPVAQFTALAGHLGIPWPPADDWMDSLPMRDDDREFDGQVWRSTMDGNPYRPPFGWELVSAPPAAEVWSASGVYTQGQVVTDAQGARRWQLQTATETAAVGREPWQAYMWAVWQEVT